MDRWWADKSRNNFLAYRRYIRGPKFLYNWFIVDLCRHLQRFYVEYLNKKKPVLIINTPPQHGKSWAITDFISWITGLNPTLRVIYASSSRNLGIRCNIALQRIYDDRLFINTFPDFSISRKRSVTLSNLPKRNKEEIEFWNKDNEYGYFKNTTVNGQIVGETLDIGIIDDPVKSRAEANSPTISEKIWNWFNDDFYTRFDNNAGMILIQTRWIVNDLAGRMIGSNADNSIKVLKYPAIADENEEHRKKGEVLFPGLKSKEFILKRQKRMFPANFQALYQCNPIIDGGNLFKDSWWRWWTVYPELLYKFIVADTAQKTSTMNDYTVFQCWGYGIDKNIYLLDKIRHKWEAPDLKNIAYSFYDKHNTKRIHVNDPTLRGMYIEDKSSGVGLIQELKRQRLIIHEVPRHYDKYFRAQDASNYIQTGRVFLNHSVLDIDNLTKEAREFPNSAFDDDIDTLMTAVEVTYINESNTNLLMAAMEAD